MSWTFSILVALPLAVAGTLFGGFLASCAVGWLRISGREGYSGYWVVFMALLAGLYSLIAGLLMLRFGGGDQALPAILAAAAVVFGPIAMAGLFAWLLRDRPPPGSGGAVFLEFEIRTPPGAVTLAGDSQIFHAYLSANKTPTQAVALDQPGLRQEEGRWLLAGSAPLNTRRPSLYLVLGGTRLNQANVYYYLTREHWASPGTWSAWMAGSPSGDLSPTTDGVDFEMRVRRRAVAPAGA